MAIRATLSTTGFDEYLEALAKSVEDVDEVASEALAAGAAVILRGMQDRVAVDTGDLQSKLSISGPYRDGHEHFVYIGLNRGIDAKTARKAVAQEYGTSKMPAHSFIRSTIDIDKAKARKAMRDIFRAKLGME
jgi:HK97 gp10 family phage protein